MYDEKEDNQPYGSCYCFADACVHVPLFRGNRLEGNDQDRNLGAMDEEVNSLKEALDEKRINTIAGMEFCEGKLDGADVVVVKCSVGKVNAAACTQILIDRFEVDQIINTGVAGSLDAAIDIGDIVVSTEAVQHDMDVTALGYTRGEIPYIVTH